MNDFKKPKKQPLNIQRGWANNTGDTLYINEDKINIQGKSINNAAPQIEIGSSTTPNLININAQSINIGTSNSTTNVLGALLNNGNPISGGGDTDLSTLPVYIGTNDTGTVIISTNQTSIYEKDVCITLGTIEHSKNSNNTGISLRMGSVNTSVFSDSQVIEIHPKDISIANNERARVVKISDEGIKIGGGSVSFSTTILPTVPRATFDLSKKYIDIYNNSNSSSISVFKLDTTTSLPLYGATIKNNEIRLGTSSTCAFYANYDPNGTSEIKLGSGTATDVWLADGSISVKMKYDSTAHTITFTDPVQGYSATIQLTK